MKGGRNRILGNERCVNMARVNNDCADFSAENNCDWAEE